MNEKINIQDIIALLAQKSDISKKDAELFIKAFLDSTEAALLEDQRVKIKDLGTFKLILNSERSSIHVATGERVVIPAHYKISFTPDNELSDKVNEPFALFEPVEINDEDESPKKEDQNRDIDPSKRSIILEDFIRRKSFEDFINEEMSRFKPTESPVNPAPFRIDNVTEEETKEIPQKETKQVDNSYPMLPFDKEVDEEDFVTEIHEEKISENNPEETIVLPAEEKPEESNEKQNELEELEESEESEELEELEKKPEELEVEESVEKPDESKESSNNKIETEDKTSLEVFAKPYPEFKEKKEEDTVLVNKKIDEKEKIKEEPKKRENIYEEKPPITRRRTSSGDFSGKKEIISLYDLKNDWDNQNKSKKKKKKFYLNWKIIAIILTLLLSGLFIFYMNRLEEVDIKRQNPPIVSPVEKIKQEVSENNQTLLDTETEGLEDVTAENDEDIEIEVDIEEPEIDDVSNEVAEVNENQPVQAIPQEANNSQQDMVINDEDLSNQATEDEAILSNTESDSKGIVKRKTISSGDRLITIAEQEYGHKIFWVYLYLENKEIITNPNSLPTGVEIVIPNPQKYDINKDDPKSIAKAATIQAQI